ncbi:MAG: peptide chain release factor 1 [Chlamydiales bacterium]|nr:peptide chain release factor 1 [Chlamydiia bacterium]MCP5508236.1 peptide chain release factor 1 [Chlamydiales bacterium]
MNKKVEKLLNRLPDIEEQLGQPDVVNDQSKYRALTQEHAYISDVKSVWDELTRSEKDLGGNRELLQSESDPEFAEVLEEDIQKLEGHVEELQKRLHNLLIPPDPRDNKNSIIEIRAGTGGDEAALFVGDCVRMYKMFADAQGWKYEQLSCTPSEVGGFKEYVMVLSGPNVYRFMKHEGGTHRVQRIPETETQGRVHTSAITVAVLVEPDDDTDVQIDEKDLRIDTYRASGAGGQHVNTTDSAVRITHIPTGVVTYSQQERSQHKNKAQAMRLLKAKIAEVERQKKEAEVASSRSSQVGSGDRSERIRTYNFPQNRVTDHRINLTRYSLDRVMQGDLLEFSEALVAHAHQEKLQ